MTKIEIEAALFCVVQKMKMYDEIICKKCENIQLCADLSKYLGKEGRDDNN